MCVKNASIRENVVEEIILRKSVLQNYRYYAEGPANVYTMRISWWHFTGICAAGWVTSWCRNMENCTCLEKGENWEKMAGLPLPSGKTSWGQESYRLVVEDYREVTPLATTAGLLSPWLRCNWSPRSLSFLKWIFPMWGEDASAIVSPIFCG